MIDAGIVRPASRVEGSLYDLTDDERNELEAMLKVMLPDVEVMVEEGISWTVAVRVRPRVPVITTVGPPSGKV